MSKIHDDIGISTTSHNNKSYENADNSVKETDVEQAQSPKLRSRFSVKWEEFVGQTTLHGLRYAFLNRPAPARAIWLIMVLSCGGFYGFTVYKSVTKFLSYPTNTVVSHKYEKQLPFPAVTVCPLNLFEKSKLLTQDKDPDFIKYGMNQSACVATAKVRGDNPCGFAMVCCCYHNLYLSSNIDLGENIRKCTSDYKQKLIEALKDSNTSLDLRQFHSSYGPTVVVGPFCKFDRNDCQKNDFVPYHLDSGICYTFNSGVNGSVLKVARGRGSISGLNVLLDSRIEEYTISRFSIGVKVFIHNQGEFLDDLGGINISPGRHAMLSVFMKKYHHLKAPYITDCGENKLKGFTYYTMPGCYYECLQDEIVAQCGCRMPSYEGRADIPTCSTFNQECTDNVEESHDMMSQCHCPTACDYIEYTYELSTSQFPSPTISKQIRQIGYNKSFDYHRENLVLLQVGFKSLSFELQKQQPAYASEALFGEIGGNMGLFLGCSLLTLIEFVDFFVAFMCEKYK